MCGMLNLPPLFSNSFEKRLTSMRMTKPTKQSVCPVKTQISHGIRPVWPESSVSAWKNIGTLATQWADSEDSDQTERMPRLIWVFAGHTSHFVGFCRAAAMFLVLRTGISLKLHLSRSTTKPTEWPLHPVWSESLLSTWRNYGSLASS